MYDVKNRYTPAFLREMPPRELQLLAGEAADSLFILRHQRAIRGREVKPHILRKTRKDIARIKTIIGER